MMDFDTAFALALDTEVIVFGAHPFTGTLTAKDEGDPRSLTFTLEAEEVTVGEETVTIEKGYQIFEGEDYTYRLADALLDNAAEDKWTEVKAKRDSVEYGGCETALGDVQTDAESQQRITSTAVFAMLGTTTWQTGWTMSDNTVVLHNKDEFLLLAATVGTHIADAHSRSQSLRELVYSQTAVEDIEALDIEALWNDLAISDENEEPILDHVGLQVTA